MAPSLSAYAHFTLGVQAEKTWANFEHFGLVVWPPSYSCEVERFNERVRCPPNTLQKNLCLVRLFP